jgi:GNAT superfamily N-acetyltransferase
MSWAIRQLDPASEPAAFDAVLRLRLRCWADQTPVELTPDDVIDHYDRLARHWIAVADDQVIGAARLTIHDAVEEVPEAVCLGGVLAQQPPTPIGFLSRLVVAPPCRRAGVGRGLDQIRIRAAQEAGCRSLLALVFDVSGQARVAQLLSQGFEVRGRGRKDTHPKFSVFPVPLVLGRILPPGARGAEATCRLRLATPGDVPRLQALIEQSVRALSAHYYTSSQIESALRHVFGPDTQLIADRTYYVIESEGGELAAAGGWSRRRTLYGGDQMKGAEDPLLEPTEAARIRAFFVHPAWARRGLGRRLFERCAEDAARAGFRKLELMATLPGEPLYRALGFAPLERVVATLPDGERLQVVHMARPLSPSPPEPGGASDRGG